MYLTKIDYELVLSSVNKEIRKELNQIVIREQQSIKAQLEYPFATYSIINPYLNAKNYRSNDTGLTQSVEIVVSYTFYSQDSFEAISIAQQALTNLEHRGTRQELWEKKITIVEMTNVQNRDTFITIETERRTGFDVRLRVAHTTSKELNDIITVELEDGSEIHK